MKCVYVKRGNTSFDPFVEFCFYLTVKEAFCLNISVKKAQSTCDSVLYIKTKRELDQGRKIILFIVSVQRSRKVLLKRG